MSSREDVWLRKALGTNQSDPEWQGMIQKCGRHAWARDGHRLHLARGSDLGQTDSDWPARMARELERHRESVMAEGVVSVWHWKQLAELAGKVSETDSMVVNFNGRADVLIENQETTIRCSLEDGQDWLAGKRRRNRSVVYEYEGESPSLEVRINGKYLTDALMLADGEVGYSLSDRALVLEADDRVALVALMKHDPKEESMNADDAIQEIQPDEDAESILRRALAGYFRELPDHEEMQNPDVHRSTVEVLDSETGPRVYAVIRDRDGSVIQIFRLHTNGSLRRMRRPPEELLGA